MGWLDLSGNQFVSRADLQDAVDKGFFLENEGVPSTDVNRWITYNEADSYVELDESKIPSGKGDWWAEKQYLVGVFPSIVTTFDKLATPRKAIYNPNNGMIYYIDYDDESYGVFYFNPLTARSKADFVGIPGTALVAGSSMHPTDIAFSQSDNKIYMHGEYTGGLIVIDCSTNTVTNTVSYGTDGQFQRQQLVILGANLWAYNASNARYEIIPLSSEAITGHFILASVPGWDQHASSTAMFINGKIWILLTSSINKSLIKIYNNVAVPDYTTDVVGTISDIGTNEWLNGKIEAVDMYWDSDHGFVYVSITADNVINVYSDSSYSSVGTISIDTEGKSYSGMYGIFRGTTNQLYLSGTLFNTLSDATRKLRTYEINRSTHAIINTQQDTQFSSMIYVDSTDLNYATIPGFTYLDDQPDYLIDGSIIALN